MGLWIVASDNKPSWSWMLRKELEDNKMMYIRIIRETEGQLDFLQQAYIPLKSVTLRCHCPSKPWTILQHLADQQDSEQK